LVHDCRSRISKHLFLKPLAYPRLHENFGSNKAKYRTEERSALMLKRVRSLARRRLGWWTLELNTSISSNKLPINLKRFSISLFFPSSNLSLQRLLVRDAAGAEFLSLGGTGRDRKFLEAILGSPFPIKDYGRGGCHPICRSHTRTVPRSPRVIRNSSSR
jgi:hypothetical protein